MSILDRILGRRGPVGQAAAAGPGDEDPRPAAAEPSREDIRPAARVAASPLSQAAPGAPGSAARYASLPGSDPGLLARIGDDVRARLDAVPTAMKAPAVNLDMYLAADFLSPEECAQLVAMIDADVRPSTSLSAAARPSHRTSETCLLPTSHPLVAEVETRIADLLGIATSHSEALQGQRYMPGQQFKMHNDYIAAGQPYSEKIASEGGQRTWTAMVYLNAPATGGQTRFPRAGVEIAPRTGALLTWNNLDRQGMPNPYSHHEGAMVEAGAKYVLTKWFRERICTKGAGSDALRP